ncbi:ATP-dependent DNA helicase [Trichonephila inaurata madagascariensis]|uniref:ATP-dependent DNA helicase n=1 Tax=Trichonephila inaurata madagascariensis TaxID=2747483 RepID=A0A8X6JHU6_9ARAC|nr:ATP-dependent DNA helicase [Trichonephila inaurata madagascariensis]
MINNLRMIQLWSTYEAEMVDFFFQDTPRGNVKTFLLNRKLTEIRLKSEMSLAVAVSEIAAMLLDARHTTHSAIKEPLNPNIVKNPIFNIGITSRMATVLKTCKLIIWGEYTMVLIKKELEPPDRTLRDCRNN